MFGSFGKSVGQYLLVHLPNKYFLFHLIKTVAIAFFQGMPNFKTSPYSTHYYLFTKLSLPLIFVWWAVLITVYPQYGMLSNFFIAAIQTMVIYGIVPLVIIVTWQCTMLMWDHLHDKWSNVIELKRKFDIKNSNNPSEST